jgi:hypothetical protein
MDELGQGARWPGEPERSQGGGVEGGGGGKDSRDVKPGL